MLDAKHYFVGWSQFNRPAEFYLNRVDREKW